MRPSLSLLISLDVVNPLGNFPQKTAFSGALVYTATWLGCAPENYAEGMLQLRTVST